MASVYDNPTHGRSSNTTPTGERIPFTAKPPAETEYEREAYDPRHKHTPEDDEEFAGVIDGRPHRQ